MQCNIDARGKAVRLINGIVGLIAGLVLLFAWALPHGGWVAWTVTGVVLLFSAFSIFEARAGWCVVRAMGFKTRI
jgi:uncharacterized membrane protein HdeD (DUF308 family)